MTAARALAIASDGGSAPAWGELRRLVQRLVAGRVPASDADDVVQTTLCAALACDQLPADQHGRARWLGGIARHKIADYYRGRSRPDGPCLTSPGPCAALEAREMLEALVEDVQDDERAMQTLRWIVREHEGERLAEIAAADRVPAATVRQRVSRMRRRLRDKWLPAVAAVVLGAFAFWQVMDLDPSRWQQPAAPIITPSLAALEGSWEVVAITSDADVDGAAASVVEPLARGARADLRGSQLVLTANAGRVALTLSVVAHGVGQSGLELSARDERGGDHRARAWLADDGRLVIDTAHGAWRGRLTLARTGTPLR